MKKTPELPEKENIFVLIQPYGLTEPLLLHMMPFQRHEQDLQL